MKKKNENLSVEEFFQEFGKPSDYDYSAQDAHAEPPTVGADIYRRTLKKALSRLKIVSTRQAEGWGGLT